MTKIKDNTAELNFEGEFTPPEEYKSIKLMWLPISTFIVDRARYQRDEVAMQKIQRMADHWSWVICGLLTVMIRKNDKAYTVDGQQRALAAELKGITHLPCLVSASSGHVEEALVFLGINRNRTAIMRAGVFKAAAAAKEEPAASIKAWADKCGLKIGYNGGGRGTFASVGALEKLWKLDEEAARKAMAAGASLIGKSNEYLRNPVMHGLFCRQGRHRRGRQHRQDPAGGRRYPHLPGGAKDFARIGGHFRGDPRGGAGCRQEGHQLQAN